MIWTLPRCIIVLFCVDFKVDSFDRPPGVHPQGSCSDLEARGTFGAMNLQRSIWSRKNLKLTLIRISHWRICKMNCHRNPSVEAIWPYTVFTICHVHCCVSQYHNYSLTCVQFLKCLGLTRQPQETQASARERF